MFSRGARSPDKFAFMINVTEIIDFSVTLFGNNWWLVLFVDLTNLRSCSYSHRIGIPNNFALNILYHDGPCFLLFLPFAPSDILFYCLSLIFIGIVRSGFPKLFETFIRMACIHDMFLVAFGRSCVHPAFCLICDGTMSRMGASIRDVELGLSRCWDCFFGIWFLIGRWKISEIFGCSAKHIF